MFPRTQRSISAYAMLCIVAVPAMFFLVEHRWDASAYYEMTASANIDYDGTENGSADAQSKVRGKSSSARILLLGCGMLGMAVGSHRRLDVDCKMLWMLVCFWLWSAATVLWSVNPAYSAYKLAVLLVFVVSAASMSRGLSRNETILVVQATCIVFLVVGLLSEFVHRTFNPLGDYRFTGTLHPNTQAAYSAILCIVSATLFLSSPRKLVPLAMFGIGGCFLVLTKSRTTAVAVVFALTVLLAARSRGAIRVWLAGGALIVGSIGAFLISFVGGNARAMLGKAAVMGRTEEVTSLTGRLPLWEELIDAISERPVLGHGYLAYWDAERVELLSDLFQWEIPHGHNMYLDVLIDGGVVGCLLFVLALLVTLGTALRSLAKDDHAIHGLVIATLCYAFFHGLGESLFKLACSPNYLLLLLMFSYVWKRTSTERRAPCARSAEADELPVLFPIASSLGANR